jgi:hypothetical protein
VAEAVRQSDAHGGSVLGQIARTSVAGVGELEVIYVRDLEGKIIELQSWNPPSGSAGERD